jgi:hypothetical protein
MRWTSPLPGRSGTSIEPSEFAFREACCSQRTLKELAPKRWISDDHLALAVLIQNQGLSSVGINFPIPRGYVTLKPCKPIASKVETLS